MSNLLSIMKNREMLKGYVYCDLADKVFIFSKLNFKCRKQAHSMATNTKQGDKIDTKYREAIVYNKDLYIYLTNQLTMNVKANPGDYTKAVISDLTNMISDSILELDRMSVKTLSSAS